ncbi:MAG: MarR family transcriptional regulator [Pseudomonadota bacterium]
MSMKDTPDVKPETPEIRGLGQSLPIQLLKVHDLVMAYFRPMLHRFRMTDQQWRVLRAIADGTTDFGDLAEATHIQPASLSRMLVGLQDRGWTTREVSETDRRQRRVTMTEEGWALFRAAAAETEAIYADLEADLGPAHAELLSALKSGTDSLQATSTGAEVETASEPATN